MTTGNNQTVPDNKVSVLCPFVCHNVERVVRVTLGLTLGRVLGFASSAAQVEHLTSRIKLNRKKSRSEGVGNVNRVKPYTKTMNARVMRVWKQRKYV